MMPARTGARPSAARVAARMTAERCSRVSHAPSPHLPKTNRPLHPPPRMWLTTSARALSSTSPVALSGEIIGGTIPCSATSHVHALVLVPSADIDSALLSSGATTRAIDGEASTKILSPCEFDGVPLRSQVSSQPLAVVALDLQRFVLDGAAGAAQPLQVGGQFEKRRARRQAPKDCHDLAV